MVISFRHLFFISLALYCSYISTIWLFNPLFIYTDIIGITINYNYKTTNNNNKHGLHSMRT